MPRLSVWLLRLSLLALLVGSGLGAWLLATEPGFIPARPALRLIHLDLLLFGWLTQFVLGVAYWMLPRHPVAPERGPVWLGWTAFALFQAGLGISLVGTDTSSHGTIAPAGHLLLAGATFIFLLLLWGRARPFGLG